jgi:hypothetical protein
MDEHTERMNAWFVESFNACIKPHVENINKLAANIQKAVDVIGEDLDVLQKNFDSVDKDLANIAANTTADIETISKAIGGDKESDGKTKLRAVDAAINKLRVEMIPTEIESMRERLWQDLIFKFGCDMNIMLADTRSLIRKNIEDEVRAAVRKEITDEVRAAVRKEMVERRHRYSRKSPPPNNVTDIGTKQKA